MVIDFSTRGLTLADPFGALQQWGQETEMQNYQTMNQAGINPSLRKSGSGLEAMLGENKNLVIGAAVVVGGLALLSAFTGRKR